MSEPGGEISTSESDGEPTRGNLSTLGVRIAGRLLEYYRVRRGYSRNKDRYPLPGSDKYAIRHVEYGDLPLESMNQVIGAYADCYDLSGREVAKLVGAIWADDFLRYLVKANPAADVDKTIQRFESLSFQLEARKWVWDVMDSGTRLPAKDFGENDPRRWELRFPSQDGHGPKLQPSAKLLRAFSGDTNKCIITESRLGEIKKHIESVANDAITRACDGKFLVDTITELLLLRATIARNSGGDATLVTKLTKLLRTNLQPVGKRHVLHALCILESHRELCKYVIDTQAVDVDRQENLWYLDRRTADAGDGVKTFDALRVYIEYARKYHLAPLLALHLRTARQLIDAKRDPIGSAWSTALTNITVTDRFESVIKDLVDMRTQSDLVHEGCDDQSCRTIGKREAKSILAAIRSFRRAVGRRTRSSRRLYLNTRKPQEPYAAARATGKRSGRKLGPGGVISAPGA